MVDPAWGGGLPRLRQGGAAEQSVVELLEDAGGRPFQLPAPGTADRPGHPSGGLRLAGGLREEAPGDRARPELGEWRLGALGG